MWLDKRAILLIRGAMVKMTGVSKFVLPLPQQGEGVVIAGFWLIF